MQISIVAIVIKINVKKNYNNANNIGTWREKLEDFGGLGIWMEFR